MENGNCGANTFQISRSLAGKHLFLSGVTGFLGKLLLAKIIRSIPDVGSVSILIRAKDEDSASQRFIDEVLGTILFRRLREEDPRRLDSFCLNKICVIKGDLTEEKIGMSPVAYRNLCQRIDLIVHCAATVKFNEDLDRSLAVNTMSLERVADMSRASGWSPVLHVSTCYVNGLHEGRIAENHREPAGKMPMGLVSRYPDGTWRVDALIRYLKRLIEKEKEKTTDPELLTRRLMRIGIQTARKFGWNDTYTFTKWIGEQVISDRMRGHSLAIVRPSIICSTLDDPFPGWVEGIKVIDVLIMGYLLGKLSVYPALARATVDLIPADLVANAVMVALSNMMRHPYRKTIVQCASGTANPLTIEKLTEHCLVAFDGAHKDIFDLVGKRSPRRPPIWTTRAPLRTLLRIRRGILSIQKIVGKFLSKDFRERITRKSRTLDNAWNNLDVLSFYGRPRCLFETSELNRMARLLDAADRKQFPVNAGAIDWKAYIESHIGGLKNHVVRPGVEKRKAKARKHRHSKMLAPAANDRHRERLLN